MAKVIAPTTVEGGWPSSGNARSGLLRSRTIPLHLKSDAPEVPYGATHTVEIQLVDVLQLCCMILSPKVEKVPATSMGLGSLHKSGLRSRTRRSYVLECQSVRDSRIESSEGLCTDADLEASRYVT